MSIIKSIIGAVALPFIIVLMLIAEIKKKLEEKLKTGGFLPFNGLDFILFCMRFDNLVTPLRLDYFKYLEYRLIFNNANLEPGLKILDIGSQVSRLPLYLVSKGCQVYATDVDNAIFEQMHMADKIAFSRFVENRQFNVQIQDARKTSYPDNYFDRIFAISSLEHLRGEDDIKVIQELRRITKSKGRICMTLPYGARFSESIKRNPFITINEPEIINYSKQSYFMFKDEIYYYEKVYDDNTLLNRIVNPSGLRLSKVEYIGEKVFPFYRLWWRLPNKLRYYSQWCLPFFSSLCLDFLDKDKLRPDGGPYSVLVVLEKD